MAKTLNLFLSCEMCVCVCMCVFVFVRTCLFACGFLCLCLSVCLCVSVCVWVTPAHTNPPLTTLPPRASFQISCYFFHPVIKQFKQLIPRNETPPSQEQESSLGDAPLKVNDVLRLENYITHDTPRH